MGTLTEQLNAALQEKAGDNPELEGNGTEQVLEQENDDDLAGETPEGQEVGGEEGGEEADIVTLADLAKVNEWDASDLYALKVSMQDGEEGIPIGELKDTVTQLRREAETYQQQVREQQAGLAQAQQAVQMTQQQDARESQLRGQFDAIQSYLQSPALATLKRDEPARAALQVQEAQQKLMNIAGERQHIQQQAGQQQAYMRQQVLAQGQHYLKQHIPEWADREVEAKEKGEIEQAMSDAGYNEDYIRYHNNPIEIAMWRKMLSQEKAMAAGGKATKQVLSSPQRTLRGGRVSGKAGNQRKAKLVSRAKRSGNKKDVMAAAKAIFNSGARK